MKLFKLQGISKKYAMNAAHYRRAARKQVPGLDFSEYSLRQLHEYESCGSGCKPNKSVNGFAYGKWVIDMTVSMWEEDIKAGNTCKAEFLSTPIERLHNTKKLKNIVAGSLFGYDGYDINKGNAGEVDG